MGRQLFPNSLLLPQVAEEVGMDLAGGSGASTYKRLAESIVTGLLSGRSPMSSLDAATFISALSAASILGGCPGTRMRGTGMRGSGWSC